MEDDEKAGARQAVPQQPSKQPGGSPIAAGVYFGAWRFGSGATRITMRAFSGKRVEYGV